MSHASDLRSGKGERDENFPVASRLIHPRHRGAILAFYNFVRTADDVADNAHLTASDKLAGLDRLEASLLGSNADEPEGVALRAALAERGLPPDHALDLLRAFRLDATKTRYRDWDDLIDYCRYSAMPVGRFMLDVHGEDRATWPASDALCAALQIINHLQDCAKDFRDLDRVYIPLDVLAAHGLSAAALAEPQAGPALRQVLAGLAVRTAGLLAESRTLAPATRDFRLAGEIATIQALATRLVDLLTRRDPLSETVHLPKSSMAVIAIRAVAGESLRRVFRLGAISRSNPGP
jgi:squalene synthase HpnC